jgi:hypothetical protein
MLSQRAEVRGWNAVPMGISGMIAQRHPAQGDG